MSYYSLDINKSIGDDITARVSLNADHELFKGHFPGQPVLPGACMIQILKHIIEEANQFKVTFITASNIKFLSVVDPRIHKMIVFTIRVKQLADQLLSVDALLMAEEKISMKFSGTYKVTR